jgi:hypothetical protein
VKPWRSVESNALGECQGQVVTVMHAGDRFRAGWQETMMSVVTSPLRALAAVGLEPGTPNSALYPAIGEFN